MISVHDYTFIVERGLLQQAQPFTVDMSYLGFHVSSAMPLGRRGSCGGSCQTS